MKNIICLLVSLVVLGSGCTLQRVAYKSEVKVTPVEGKAGQYLAECRLYNLSGNKPSCFVSPRVTLLEGQQAEMSVGDDADQTTFTVQVEKEGAVTTAKTTVVVKKDGRDIWMGQQTVSFAQ